MKWMSPVTFGLIALICLMPVLGAWAWTLPLLGLLLILKPEKGWLRARAFGGWEFGLVGLIFGITAAISTGFRPGWNGFSPQTLLETESWILMAWLVSRTIPRKLEQKILRFLVLSSPVWIFPGFWQLALGIPTNPDWLSGPQRQLIQVRIFSVFVNPNIYAIYLLGIFVLAVEFAAGSLKRRFKIFYRVIAGLALLSLYFTYSRMAWLLAGVYGFGRLIHRFQWRGWLVSTATLLGLLALPASRIRLGGLINFTDSSLLYRIQIWRGVIRALGDYWLWGAGPGSFPAVYHLFQLGDTPAQHAHQLYLQIWLEYGIFALAGFVWLVAQLLRKHDGPGLRAVLLIFLGYGFSETWYLNHFMGGFFWLAAGLLGAAPRGGPNHSQQQGSGDDNEKPTGKGIRG